ncbi:gliding motility lipoprotein GldD [Bacteroidota bacterium]
MLFYKSKILGFVFLFCLINAGCKKTYTPKPRGFYRIDLPEKIYKKFDRSFPYSFQYPDYTNILIDISENAEPYWIDIDYPQLNGKIHISYKTINNNFNILTEDSRTFAYKHAVKANAINETFVQQKDKKVYGIIYEIKGNAASSIQFHLTDSVRNFLRGSLYFYEQPNVDSLAPVINFCKKDIEYLIETFEWNN